MFTVLLPDGTRTALNFTNAQDARDAALAHAKEHKTVAWFERWRNEWPQFASYAYVVDREVIVPDGLNVPDNHGFNKSNFDNLVLINHGYAGATRKAKPDFWMNHEASLAKGARA